MTFNIVREPCIPITRGKKGGLASLLETIVAARSIHGLATPYPTQMPAVLRQLILPVVLDALGAPRTHGQWQQLFQLGSFTQAQRECIEDYLDEYGHRFDLFDEVRPFAQTGGLLTAKGETKPVSLIIPSAASGNNVPLFSSRTEGDILELEPADALLWLLHVHCWDTAAIKTGAAGDPVATPSGKTTGNPTGPLGQLGMVVPAGRTLFETIMLNIPIQPHGMKPGDSPQWRRRPLDATWTERRCTGLLDLFTWQSRRIRLFPELSDDGRVRVARVVVAAGDRLAELPVDVEPHTAWRADRSSMRPYRHAPGRASWREFDTLLALDRPGDSRRMRTSILLRQVADLHAGGRLPDDYPLRVHTVGVQYGSQLAVVEEVVADMLPLPLAALGSDPTVRNVLLDIADQAERLAETLNLLSADLRRAAGGKALPWDRGQRPGELLLHAIDPLVRRLLPPLRRAGDDPELVEPMRHAWELGAWRAARDQADQLLAHVSAAAAHGREVEQRWYRAATAEQSFDRQLRRLLPRAAGVHGPDIPEQTAYQPDRFNRDGVTANDGEHPVVPVEPRLAEEPLAEEPVVAEEPGVADPPVVPADRSRPDLEGQS